MTWYILSTFLGVMLTIGGQAFRNWWQNKKQLRVLEKTQKTILETEKVMNDVQARPLADGQQLADRFRMRED